MATTGLGDFDLPPFKDWQKFERFCRDLWAVLWDDLNTQANGRNGQEQAGVDVFGRRAGHSAYSGVQCKKRGTEPDDAEITEKELRAEVEKAKSFKPALGGEFVLAFTGRRDAKIQAVARTISQEHAAVGLFEVHVYSWDDIQERLVAHPEILASHYPQLIATVRTLIGLLPEPNVPTSSSVATAEGIRPRSPVIEPSTIPADVEYAAEIQIVRTTLKEGHPRLALTQGTALRTRIWDAANPVTRARLLVLLAHAHLELADAEQAAKLLLEAAGQAPNDSYVQAQVALGHSLAGNREAATAWAEKALAQNPTDIVAIQVAALHDASSDEEVFSKYDATVGKRAEVYAVLGHRAAQRRDLPKAREWFDAAIALDPLDPNMAANAAGAIIDSVSSDATSRFDGSMAARPDLLRAVALLDSAIATLSDESMRKARADWFVSRVFAKRLLLAPDTIASAEAALAACGRPDELVRLRAAIASDAGDHKLVVELLEPLALPRDFDHVGLLAAAYGNLGQLDRSTALWLELLQRHDLPEPIRHEAERNHARSLILANKYDEARSTAQARLTRSPDSLSAHLVAITVAGALSDTAIRDELLEKAIALAATGSLYLRLQLGDALMSAERWADAADVYGQSVESGVDNFYGRRHLQALYKAGRYDTLLKACDAVEVANGLTRFVAELRSSVYELLGDLPRAAEACRKFLEVEPAHPVLGLRLALVLQRSGDQSASEAALDQIDVDAMPDVESLSMLARMLVHLGKRDDALRVAYRMRKRHPGDVQAHLRYVSIYMSTKGAAEEPTSLQVTLGSAVKLAGTGAPRWVLVSSEDNADVNQNEYPPGHPLSAALLGKGVGDTIPILSTDRPWTVVAIGTKYGFAFGRTLELFPSHFPDAQGLEQHDFGEGGAESFAQQLKARLKQHEPQREWILNEYAAGRMGVGSVANVLGLSTWQVMGLLLGSRGLLCSTNTVDERTLGLGLLRSEELELVLDPTAIISLDEAGLLREGALSGRKLVVAQRTMDAVASELARWESTSDEGSMSLGVEGESLVRYQTSADDVRRYRAYFRELLDWLRSNATSAPVSPAAAERHTVREDAGELIGEAFWDSVRIATEPGRVLISDDLWLRRLGQGELSVRGACTAVLLMAELEAGRLERLKFSDAIARMIVAGYRMLPCDAHVLEAAARFDQWKSGLWLSKVLGTLRSPDADERSAVLVAGHFLRAICLNVVRAAQRAALVLAVLDAVAVGRTRADVAKGLLALIAVLLRLYPDAHDEVTGIIEGWERMRPIQLVRS